MIKAKKHVLPNGLKVILAHMPSSPTVTVQVSVETGSKYESKKEAGLSHFLEHMCFKGTEKRPTAQDVARDLDELGATYNAFTDKEITSYYAKAGSKTVSGLIDIVSDIYLHSTFKDSDIATEKGVITEEINMYEDEPRWIAPELFDKIMHGDQPAGRPIIGSKESVRSFTSKDFYNYHKKHYVASATTIAVAGNFNEKNVLKQIKDTFKNAPTSRKYGKEKTTIKHRGKQIAVKQKDTDQVHFVLGVRSFSYRNENNAAVSVLRGVLSRGMSSRLWKKMREELGICYYVNSSNGPSTDHGEFVVLSGVDPKRVDIAISAISEELKELKYVPVQEKELKRVKSSMISVLHMGLESSDEVAGYFTYRSMFYNDLKSPSDIEQEIKKVTAKDVQNIAKKIFTNKDLVLAIVGKSIDKKRLSKVLDLE